MLLRIVPVFAKFRHDQAPAAPPIISPGTSMLGLNFHRLGSLLRIKSRIDTIRFSSHGTDCPRTARHVGSSSHKVLIKGAKNRTPIKFAIVLNSRHHRVTDRPSRAARAGKMLPAPVVGRTDRNQECSNAALHLCSGPDQFLLGQRPYRHHKSSPARPNPYSSNRRTERLGGHNDGILRALGRATQ